METYSEVFDLEHSCFAASKGYNPLSSYSPTYHPATIDHAELYSSLSHKKRDRYFGGVMGVPPLAAAIAVAYGGHVVYGLFSSQAASQIQQSLEANTLGNLKGMAVEAIVREKSFLGVRVPLPKAP
ncbi:TPA: hypothetical protein HA295_06555 [Candidatus Woesearchaeota archaeon]|nr:hypothetical protein [Candidatus Woesearchaeota archaeon]HII66400.1 hypothetical protein [Candidatus Woesearchaeota archaeon]